MPSVPVFLGRRLPDDMWEHVPCSTCKIKSNASGTSNLYWAWSSDLYVHMKETHACAVVICLEIQERKKKKRQKKAYFFSQA